jgi:hypothetical protein
MLNEINVNVKKVSVFVFLQERRNFNFITFYCNNITNSIFSINTFVLPINPEHL